MSQYIHHRYWLGKKLSPEHIANIKKGRAKSPLGKGARHSQWKGGVTPMYHRIRLSARYKEWRIRVFERDDYTCQDCGGRNGNGKHYELNADHIKPFAKHPKLVFDLDNGRTLCTDCHRKTLSYGRRSK